MRTRRTMAKRVFFAFTTLALGVVCWAAFCSQISRLSPVIPQDAAASQAQAVATAQAGTSIVTAIYDFKNRSGLWPCNLAEMVPEYVTPESARGWQYSWHLAGWWQLTN